MIAVLTVIAVLAGATVVGGTLLAGNAVTSAVAEEEETDEPTDGPSESPTDEDTPTTRPSPTPTPSEEPTPTEEPSPTEEPEDLLTAEEVVNELRSDHDIEQRFDTTEDVCEEESDEDDPLGDLFSCSSAMDTDLVRVIAFDNAIVAGSVSQNMEDNLDDGDAIDVTDACHVVLVWFEENNTEQDQRDTIADDATEAIGCP